MQETVHPSAHGLPQHHFVSEYCITKCFSETPPRFERKGSERKAQDFFPDEQRGSQAAVGIGTWCGFGGDRDRVSQRATILGHGKATA